MTVFASPFFVLLDIPGKVFSHHESCKCSYCGNIRKAGVLWGLGEKKGRRRLDYDKHGIVVSSNTEMAQANQEGMPCRCFCWCPQYFLSEAFTTSVKCEVRYASSRKVSYKRKCLYAYM